MSDATTGGRLRERPCVLFDFDGTLADTKPGIIATATKVLREWGMTDEEIGDPGRLIGPPFPRAYTMIYGVSEADADELCRRYRAEYAKLGREAYGLFDGIEPLLRDLRRQGRRLAVASSKREDFVKRMLFEDGVADAFDAVIAQTDPARADKASLISDALAALGCSPGAAVMVGDRSYDVEGARANGVPCVGVLFGTATRRELEDAGAAAIVTSVAELRRVLLG